jgi:hypothetical protein
MNMKLSLVLATALTAGCASVGGIQGDANAPTGGGGGDAASAPDVFAPVQLPNMGPQIVLPVTGGAPVIGIPLGGNIFQPVTGGPPVIGIPTSP